MHPLWNDADNLLLSVLFGENFYANVSLLRNRKFDLISQSGWITPHARDYQLIGACLMILYVPRIIVCTRNGSCFRKSLGVSYSTIRDDLTKYILPIVLT